jgi:hypothetical protein
VRRVVLTASVVSSIRLRKPGSSTLPFLKAHQRRRMAAIWSARKIKKEAVSALSRDFDQPHPPTTHRTPAMIPSVSSSRTQKTHSVSCPRLAARYRHGRPCRHVAASRTRAHPPPERKKNPAGNRAGFIMRSGVCVSVSALRTTTTPTHPAISLGRHRGRSAPTKVTPCLNAPAAIMRLQRKVSHQRPPRRPTGLFPAPAVGGPALNSLSFGAPDVGSWYVQLEKSPSPPWNEEIAKIFLLRSCRHYDT